MILRRSSGVCLAALLDVGSLAIEWLKASRDKDPKNARYEYHLGLAYAGAGDLVRTRGSLTRALALKPDFDGAAEARTLLGSEALR